jgi:hypothetical protein
MTGKEEGRRKNEELTTDEHTDIFSLSASREVRNGAGWGEGRGVFPPQLNTDKTGIFNRE